MHRQDRYEKSPFLNLADELLLVLKENLISQLTIVSASNGIVNKNSRKDRKFKKTFGKFPTTNLVLEPTNRLGKKRPRWEWIKEQDFDIFIDDSYNIITESQKICSSEKIFAIPDYAYAKSVQLPNVYHVKTTVSDLKDSDFAIAALEKNLQRLEKEIKVAATKKNNFYPYIVITLLGIIFFLGCILALLVVRNKRRQV